MKNSEQIKKINKNARNINNAFINQRITDEHKYNTIKNQSRQISARFKELKELDGDGCLDFPEDTSLPFFAYGVFKPGEISYPRIECFVEEIFPKVEDGKEISINYTLYERDGIPTVFKEKTDGITYGYIIKFKEEDEKEAYDVIRKVESNTFYEWSEEPIYINKKQVNMLFGKDPTKSRPEEADETSYKGVNDVFFKYTIPLILMDLEKEDGIRNYNHLSTLEKEYSNKLDPTIKRFFKLQRNYVFLWAAIERYTSLKYGENSKTYNNKLLSEEEIFKHSLKYFVKKQNNKKRLVYGTQNFDEHYLDPDDWNDSIVYYYTLRSNVVHRGKGSMGAIDEKVLRKSLFELLAIFQFILKDTFDEYEIIEVNDKESGIVVNEKIWKNFKQKLN